MKSRALRVPRSTGEAVRRTLQEAGLLRSDLRISEDDTCLLLPVSATGTLPAGIGEPVVWDFEPAADRGPRDYRDLLAEWNDRERELLPRAFDVVGDIVLVRLPPELTPRQGEVGSALLRFVPGARLVGADHGVQGPERRREVVRIAGSGPWRTQHRENGLEFDVDVQRAYFSPRLAREHARVADACPPGARVYDLCCGVGPFAITIAHRPGGAQVAAVDSNPAAIELLRGTSARYGLEARVRPIEGRVEEFVARAGPVERVILNLPHEGIKYLASVGNVVSPAGRLFYYEVTAREAATDRPNALLEVLGGPQRWRLVDSHVVHPYSPAADLTAFQFERLAP